jgi:hypothetical protein
MATASFDLPEVLTGNKYEPIAGNHIQAEVKLTRSTFELVNL